MFRFQKGFNDGGGQGAVLAVLLDLYKLAFAWNQIQLVLAKKPLPIK